MIDMGSLFVLPFAGGSVRSDNGAGTGNGGTRRKLPEDDEEGEPSSGFGHALVRRKRKKGE